jgi:two-component system sensor histidine kinase BaeS
MMKYSNQPGKPEYESQRNWFRRHRGEWTHRPWKFDPHQRNYRAKRRTLFGRFMVFLVFLALPLVGLGILFGTLISTAENTPMRFQMVLTFICGLPLIVTAIIATIGALVFRNLGTPLAKIMSAADAVAEGDLSTRLEESGPGEFRRMARSFNRMTAELERADQQRRNLTADIAHELRTPLHILQGNLEGLQDGVYQPTLQQIQAMLDETQMLARLVDDLQTLSLAEAGQLHLRLEPLDISELLADVATSFSGQMQAAGIDLKVKTEGTPLDLTIRADPERLDQVLSNLVGNALRHTSQDGTIILTAESTSEGVRILVRDTGEGIPPEDLPYIFDRFWRADKSRQRKSGAGSGLGLAIAKQIIGAHGGHIAVESQPGVGTSFTIDLLQDPSLS